MTKKLLCQNPPSAIGLLYPRPRISPYFVGRTSELEILREKVEEHGSVAITGFGGLGKPEVMTMFALQAEKEGSVPGGVYWLTADGDGPQIIESLAAIAEKLQGSKIGYDDRKSAEIVVQHLRKALSRTSGRWLFCMDNVEIS